MSELFRLNFRFATNLPSGEMERGSGDGQKRGGHAERGGYAHFIRERAESERAEE